MPLPPKHPPLNDDRTIASSRSIFVSPSNRVVRRHDFC
jgi:hypothetical protein